VRELQALPVERIISAYFELVREMDVDQMTMGFAPTVIGRFVPRHPFAPDASPVMAEVPVMKIVERRAWRGHSRIGSAMRGWRLRAAAIRMLRGCRLGGLTRRAKGDDGVGRPRRPVGRIQQDRNA
jgi:hypothetical protein